MKIPMTKKGYEQLKDELDRLKKVERPKIVAEIAEARGHGDLSENAEYHAARERQGFIEGRIKEVESKLASAQVIDTANFGGSRVVFGATVVLRDLSDESQREFTLVGQDESDLKNGKISVHSPVGKALINHEIGDTVEIITPAKRVAYEILDVRFGEI